MKNLFNKNISPCCAYCAIGKSFPQKNEILCVKKGVVGNDYHCKSFKYDPLKRVPKKQMPTLSFEKSDFSLD